MRVTRPPSQVAYLHRLASPRLIQGRVDFRLVHPGAKSTCPHGGLTEKVSFPLNSRV